MNKGGVDTREAKVLLLHHLNVEFLVVDLNIKTHYWEQEVMANEDLVRTASDLKAAALVDN